MAVAPVEAQSIRQSISRAAVDAAAAAQNRRGGIAPAYLWTGVGLLGGAALFATAAAVLGGEDCTTASGANFTQTICVDYDASTTWAVAGATAAAGAVVLILGAKKGRSATSITFTPGGVAVRSVPLTCDIPAHASYRPTHDLAPAGIADRLAPRAANVHFDDAFEAGSVRFDYRVKPGLVTRSNAIALMKSVGLDVD